MSTHSIRTLPAAAALAAALLFGAHAQAQNNTTPPGTTKPTDASVSPAPGGASAAKTGAGTGAGTSGASAGSMAATPDAMPPGTTKPTNAATPAPGNTSKNSTKAKNVNKRQDATSGMQGSSVDTAGGPNATGGQAAKRDNQQLPKTLP